MGLVWIIKHELVHRLYLPKHHNEEISKRLMVPAPLKTGRCHLGASQPDIRCSTSMQITTIASITCVVTLTP